MGTNIILVRCFVRSHCFWEGSALLAFAHYFSLKFLRSINKYVELYKTVTLCTSVIVDHVSLRHRFSMNRRQMLHELPPPRNIAKMKNLGKSIKLTAVLAQVLKTSSYSCQGSTLRSSISWHFLTVSEWVIILPLLRKVSGLLTVTIVAQSAVCHFCYFLLVHLVRPEFRVKRSMLMTHKNGAGKITHAGTRVQPLEENQGDGCSWK